MIPYKLSGHTVLAYYKLGDDSAIVLLDYGPRQLATGHWRIGDSTWSWGHYFPRTPKGEASTAAFKDFMERCKRGY